MQTKFLNDSFNDEQDRHVAQIVLRITASVWITYLIVLAMNALLWHDRSAIFVMLLGCGLLLIPPLFLYRGELRASGISLVLNVIITVTVLATIGQGIHDIAVTAYPAIVIIAYSLLQRRDFFVAVALSLGAIGWLVFGEASGFFATRPYQTPNALDFTVVVVIMLTMTTTVDLLDRNMRESLRMARQEIAQRKALEEQLRHQSMHDALTGVYNRFFFEEEFARFEASREFPISVVVIDLDNLKITNDTMGHSAGDSLLCHTANMLRSVFRANDDVLARIGGDEFAILLPRTTRAMTEQILSRVYAQLEIHNRLHPELPVLFSLGISTAERSNLSKALKLADQRMYADKARRKRKNGTKI